MNEVTYDNMSEQLIEAVPELRSRYQEELDWWREEKPPTHVMYGNLLNPFLIALLETNNQDEVLRRVFGFLEKLARHEDILVREVVAVTVLERLWGEKDLWAKAQEIMGKETLRIAQAVEINRRDGTPLQSI